MTRQVPAAEPTQPHDPLLAPLLAARDAAAREEAASALLTTHADPVIRRSIRHRLGIANPADVEDIRSAALLRLLRKLEQLATSDPIVSFPNYVATVTYHSVDDYLRKKYPERTLLKNRLRYLLTHDARFALWERERRSMCGRAEWAGGPERSSTRELSPGDERRLAESLEQIFDDAGGPVDFEALISLFPSATAAAPREVEATDGAPSVAQQFDAKELLVKLWSEIEQLPPRQRTALLLNLRDENGSSALPLLPASGVGVAKIAGCIGMTRDELAAVWNELPFDDHRIGAMLSATRQQVINLRKSARERLARRLSRRKAGGNK